jgi:predicted small lipoprotein YifL
MPKILILSCYTPLVSQTVILIVKSTFNLPRLAAISIAIALTNLLTACGQMGPLYMPAKPAPAATPANTAIPAPAVTPVPASR